MIAAAGFMHSIALFISKNIFYLLIAVLALNMFQRRYQKHAQKKRLATLYLGIFVLAFMIGTILIVYFTLPDILIVPLAAILVLFAYLKRRHVFPFRLYCLKCGERLSMKRILYFDSNTCERCAQNAPSDPFKAD
jgi:hypothetical protein